MSLISYGEKSSGISEDALKSSVHDEREEIENSASNQKMKLAHR